MNVARYIRTIFFVSAILIFTLLAFFLYDNIAKTGLYTLNERQAIRDGNNAKALFEKRVEGLETLTEDWGYWDDSYKFIQDLNQEFIESNIKQENMLEQNINLIVYYNADGQAVFKKSASIGYIGDTTAPEEVFKFSRGNDKFQILDSIENARPHSGIFHTSSGTFLYAIHPVTDTKALQKPNGAVLMARFTNSTDENVIRTSTGKNISLFELSAASKFIDEIMIDDLIDKQIITKRNVPYINTYVLVKDSFGTPTHVIKLEQEIVGDDIRLTLVFLITGITLLNAIGVSLVTLKIHRNYPIMADSELEKYLLPKR
mgnify:CR=1 FL=1